MAEPARPGVRVHVVSFTLEDFLHSDESLRQIFSYPEDSEVRPDIIAVHISPARPGERKKIKRIMNAHSFSKSFAPVGADTMIFFSPRISFFQENLVKYSSTSPAQQRHFLVVKCEKLEGASPRSPRHQFWFCASHLEANGSGSGFRAGQIFELGEFFSTRQRDGLPVIFAGQTCIPSWQEVSLGPPNFSQNQPSPRLRDTSFGGVAEKVSSPGQDFRAYMWEDAWSTVGNSENQKTTETDRSDQIWFSSSPPNGSLDILSFDFASDDGYRKSIYTIFSVFSPVNRK